MSKNDKMFILSLFSLAVGLHTASTCIGMVNYAIASVGAIICLLITMHYALKNKEDE